jgi:hypothetical protein
MIKQFNDFTPDSSAQPVTSSYRARSNGRTVLRTDRSRWPYHSVLELKRCPSWVTKRPRMYISYERDALYVLHRAGSLPWHIPLSQKPLKGAGTYCGTQGTFRGVHLASGLTYRRCISTGKFAFQRKKSHRELLFLPDGSRPVVILQSRVDVRGKSVEISG